MDIQNSNIYELLETSSELLLDVLKKPDGPFSECPDEIKAIINAGVSAARDGDLDFAITKFQQAATLEPNYVGSRLRLIKAYKAIGK